MQLKARIFVVYPIYSPMTILKRKIIRQENKKDLLIPAIKDCVKQIDLEAGRMVICLLPGLLEASEGGAK